MIISAADSMKLADGSSHPTGHWAEEVAASHRILREAGVDVDIATPGGVSPTVDSLSLDERGGLAPADAEEFRTYLGGLGDDLAHPLPLAEVPSDDYDALCIPGGHAPMVDLAVDKELGACSTLPRPGERSWRRCATVARPCSAPPTRTRRDRTVGRGGPVSLPR